MKQIIIMTAMIGISVAIFSLIAGGDDSSLMSFMKTVWEEEIQVRTCNP